MEAKHNPNEARDKAQAEWLLGELAAPETRDTNVKHKPATPLPWRTSPARSAEVQQQSGVRTIGLMGMDGAVNAAYIAHACNAYPRLVKAARYLAAMVEDAALIRADPADTQPARVMMQDLLRELGEME